MSLSSRPHWLATAFYRLSLVCAFILSGTLVATIFNSGLTNDDLRSLWTLWIVILIANPFAAIAFRYYYRKQLENDESLALFAGVILGLVGLHISLLVSLQP